MQMDLWVVAAATGAGYLAKYWKDVLGDKEGSSGSALPDKPESPSTIRKRPARKFARTVTAEQCFSEAGKDNYSDGLSTEIFRGDDPFTAELACTTNALDHEKQIEKYEENNDGYRLDADIPDIPEYQTWEMGASHSSSRSRKCLRSRRLQRFPLQYVKPRTSLDSCLMAQMQREHAEMEEFLRTPLSSPCAPSMRPFLVTDGRQVISRTSSDFRNELYKEIRQKADDEVVGVPHLPQITTTKQKLSKGKNQLGKSSNTNKPVQFDARDGSLSGQVLFCLGISIGVMSSMIANKGEVEKLKMSLKQSENLVEDLQEELEMKDSLTVKELINDDDSQDIHESLCSHEKLNLFPDQADPGMLIRFDDEESVSLEKIESMSKIEAELEAELERLELSMKGSILQGRSSDAIEFDQEFDQDIASELVHGELNADIFRGKSSSEPTPNRGSTPQSVKEGVSPHELSLRLHEVIQSRLQERIIELETELAKSQKRVQNLETEKHSWIEISRSESSSTLGSPVSRPLVMNLSGDALDAYNEAFSELNKLGGSQNGDLGIQGNGQQANLLSSNQGMGDKLNGVQNGRNRIPPNEGSPNDYDYRDDGDDDLLLIKQIVEKARQGSPAILRAQKAMVWLNIDES